jgi:hypothetical protein
MLVPGRSQAQRWRDHHQGQLQAMQPEYDGKCRNRFNRLTIQNGKGSVCGRGGAAGKAKAKERGPPPTHTS